MSEGDVTTELESLLRRTVNKLLRTEKDLEAERSVRTEPIAVVSMACRLPGGVRSPEEYWALLERGGDAMERFPARWFPELIYDPDPEVAGKSYVNEAGHVHDVELFDAGFFGIAPREAQGMDPQQRVILELAWEAFERAGMTGAQLSESLTGVYVGVGSGDYLLQRSLEACDGYVATGTGVSVVAGRVSYALGLRGPALAVDTACSSSLVAVHLACAALRQGECDVALAGGVTVLSTPMAFVEFSRLRVMSATGRCKSFSAQADGANWGEGCGLVVLKRLADARRDGDHVLAVIRGTAVNQDGRSQGLTAPNGPAQQRVIRDALAASRLTPADIDAIEAHGTGTPLGDPIEGNALAAVFGPGRDPERPVFIGSSKSNLGHTMCAAGIAGLLKMVLALQHERLPKTLHAEQPTPHIAWQGSGLALLQETRPWERGERVRRAGVSAFGICGTNVHAILEEAPRPVPVEQNIATGADTALAVAHFPLLISGRDRSALRAQAERWADWLAANPEQPLSDAVSTAARHRTHFDARAAIFADHHDEAIAALRALARGSSHAALVEGVDAREQNTHLQRGKTVFVFPGQGGQWLGMGRALLTQSAAFAETVHQCDAALRPFTGWSVLALLRHEQAAGLPPIDRIDVVQPALFTVFLGLAAAWRALGVEPAAVIGFSQGEVAAAVVAGALSLEDGARVTMVRCQSFRTLEAPGMMLVVERPVAEVERRLAGYGAALSIAAINSASSTVVAGEVGAGEALLAELEAAGIFCRRVKDAVASHSAYMDPLMPGLRAGLAGLKPSSPEVPFYSTVTGAPLSTQDALDAEYWCRNVRQTVRFDRALSQLLADGYRTFVEVGPHPVLAIPLTNACAEVGALVVGSLQRGQGELSQLHKALGELHVHGFTVSWDELVPRARKRLDLPTYAFQRQRYWVDQQPSGAGTTKASSAAEQALWTAVEKGDADQVAKLLRAPSQASQNMSTLLPYLSAWRQQQAADAAIEPWLYDETWQPQSVSAAAQPLSGRWLLVTSKESGPELELVAVALRSAGVRVSQLEATFDRASLHRALVELAVDGLSGIITFSPLDEQAHPVYPDVPSGLAQTLTLAQALLDSELKLPLWVLTRGAVSTRAGDVVGQPRQTQVWGLGRAFALEHPECWGGLVDLPTEVDAAEIDALLKVISAGDHEDQVALRGGMRFVRRLERVRLAERDEPYRPRGTILLTGGTGALATHLARWLSKEGAEHLVLASRRGAAAPGAEELKRELEQDGTRVSLAKCDVARRAEVAALLASLEQDEAPLTTVVHLAAVGSSGPLRDLELPSLAHELSVKAGGAFHLHELLGNRELDAFVLYGSGAALWGGAQQGAYGAANAGLDGLARHRQSLGLNALVVHWGGWADGGMLTSDAEALFARQGLKAMAPDRALRGLALALASKRTSLGVSDMDWSSFAPVFAAARSRPLLLGIAEARAALENSVGAQLGEASPLLQTLQQLAPSDRLAPLTQRIQTEVAVVLRLEAGSAVASEDELRKLGLDSLMAVELRNRLSALLSLKLPATLAFDHRTPVAIAQAILERLFADAPTPTPTQIGAPRASARTSPVETTHVVQLDGMEMAYAMRGEGEPLLLLHGWMGTRDDFLPFGEDLGRGYRCIYPDLRGHGHSLNFGKLSVNHRQSARDLFALLEHLNIDRFHAIGVSFGANILLHMATLQPARVGSLVHVSGGTCIPPHVRAATNGWQGPISQEDWRAMREQHVHGDAQITQLLDQAALNLMDDEDLNFRRPLLSTITARTLIVCGDHDAVYPVEMALELYRAIPRAQLWVMPNAPHAPVYRGLEQVFVSAAMDFLREESLSPRPEPRPSAAAAKPNLRMRVDAFVLPGEA